MNQNRTRRRLQLRRSTLRTLSDQALGQVAGGTIVQTVACTYLCGTRGPTAPPPTTAVTIGCMSNVCTGNCTAF